MEGGPQVMNAEQRPTPITDAAKALFCPGRFFVFSEVSENLERQLAEANEKIHGLQDGIEYATAALMREKTLADRLAEAAMKSANVIGPPDKVTWSTDNEINDAWNCAQSSLSAWKEARNDN